MPKPTITPWQQRTSVRERAIRHYVFFVVGVITTLAITIFIVTSALVEQRVLSQVSSAVAAKEDSLERFVQADRERTAFVSSKLEMRSVLRVRGGDSVLDDIRLSFENEQRPVSGIAVFDLEGVTVATTGVDVIAPSTAYEGTVVEPVVTDEGWLGHIVYSPVRDLEGTLMGYIGMQFDMTERLAGLRDAYSIGQTAEVLLGFEQNGELILAVYGTETQPRSPLVLGNTREQFSYNTPIASAVSGLEGVGVFEDYRGEEVYAAYRTVPSLRWGLVVKIDEDEVYRGVSALGIFLSLAGILFALGSGIIAYALSTKLTNPIVDLGKKMGKLGPGHWNFKKTIDSGDEIELLDRTVFDMATRLKKLYGNLEKEVKDRTKELKEQYIKDHAILETIQHGVIAVDHQGVVTDINKAAADMLHIKQEDLIGHPVEEVLLVCQRGELCSHDANPVTMAMRERKTFKAILNDHMNVVRKDDTLIPISITVTPLMDGKKVLGAVAAFEDISEDRRMDYIKSEFISLASHQLRTPLSMIGWYTEILKNDRSVRLSKVQQESLKEMITATKRMNDLVDTLLRTAKLEGGSIEPEFTKCNVQKMISDLVHELKAFAKEKKIACSASVPSKAVSIQTDPVLLRIVFQNLFSNAVKYSKERGEVEVTLKKNQKTVELIVSDSGIGIPDRDQELIFKRFYRAHNAAELSVDGSGLGLYISRLIIEMLGGTVTFVSKEGRGSIFTVKLPIKQKKKKA